MMNRSQSRAKSAIRRPLADKSNCSIKPQKSCLKKETVSIVERGKYDSVEGLLIVRSDLTDLISQINELVTQASHQKELTKKGNQEIESFTNFLSDIKSSLKPWVSTIQEAINSKDETKICSTPYTSHKINVSQVKGKTDFSQIDMLVSPSPLVSWRPGPCTVIDAGKQLFLLTPLPKSRLSQKTLIPSKSETNLPNCELLGFQPTPKSSKTLIRSKPTTEINPKKDKRHEELTTIVKPVSLGFENPVSENLDFNYHKILGFNESPKMFNRKRDVSGTLDWFFSPPKTCLLMEPSDEKKSTEKELQLTPKSLTIKSKKDENFENDLNISGCNDLYMSTVGKKKGEATLKRELWTRFEAVSGRDFNRVDGKLGFWDMLEEASN